MRRVTHGLTVLEVLVVCVIVTTLATILVPFVTLTRETGRTASCLSNCRQIAFAVHMYIEDHDGDFPTSCMTRTDGPQMSDPQSWLIGIQPYIRTQDALRCADDSSPLWTNTEMPRRSSYAFNGYFVASEPPYYGLDLSQVIAPSRCILTAEVSDAWICDVFLPMYWGSPSKVSGEDERAAQWDAETSKPTAIADCRHRQGANYIFADCHASWQFFQQTYSQVEGAPPAVDAYDPEGP